MGRVVPHFVRKETVITVAASTDPQFSEDGIPERAAAARLEFLGETCFGIIIEFLCGSGIVRLRSESELFYFITSYTDNTIILRNSIYYFLQRKNQ